MLKVKLTIKDETERGALWLAAVRGDELTPFSLYFATDERLAKLLDANEAEVIQQELARFRVNETLDVSFVSNEVLS